MGGFKKMRSCPSLLKTPYKPHKMPLQILDNVDKLGRLYWSVIEPVHFGPTAVSQKKRGDRNFTFDIFPENNNHLPANLNRSI